MLGFADIWLPPARRALDTLSARQDRVERVSKHAFHLGRFPHFIRVQEARQDGRCRHKDTFATC